MAEDTLDKVLQQTMMVAFAIPEVGPAVGAVVGAFDAVYDHFGKDTPRQEYSVAKAISDLGDAIAADIVAAKEGTRLAKIRGWQTHVTQLATDLDHWASTGNADELKTRMANFISDDEYRSVLASFDDDADRSEDRVKALDTYLMARSAYHSLCSQFLQLRARSEGYDPDTQWIHIGDPIRDRLETSLADASTYAEATVKMLEDGYANSEEKAKAAVAAMPDGFKKTQAFTKELQRLRRAAHLDATTEEKTSTFRTILDVYAASHAGLKKEPLTPRSGTPAPTGGKGGSPAGKPTATHLPARPAGVVRFLYEHDASGSWVAPMANSPVGSGFLVTQNAGSCDHAFYYKVDGGTLNAAFKSALSGAGQLSNADKAIAVAYDAKYGAGAFAADSAADPARCDRLTSFYVPVAPAGPIGSDVCAMIYSVGPKLGAKGIENEPQYTQVYTDALDAIAAFNADTSHPPISCFRVTLLSTGVYAGTSDIVALKAQAAGLIIDAVHAAAVADPSVAALTVLVNSNDAKGGSERVGFDTAAAARGLTTTTDGFDVPVRKGS